MDSKPAGQSTLFGIGEEDDLLDQGRGSEVARYRPTLRPPMAKLIVYDDGSDTGEVIRIRKSSFVIGRAEGDLILPHDSQISSRHLEIQRRERPGGHDWILRDLGSTNGTFVRATQIIVKPNQVMMIGGKRFGQIPPRAGGNIGATIEGEKELLDVAQEGFDELVPCLQEINYDGVGKRHKLTKKEHWIGSDPVQCSILINDPTVSPKHARIYQDQQGRWIIDDAKSLNGIWLRIKELNLGKGGYFHCGEQRFSLTVA